MKLLICFGTRPEYIKLIPLFRSFPKELYDICFVEQHKDLIIEEDLKYRISIQEYSSNRLNSIISSILVSEVPWKDYSIVLVQGDTASAFGAALCAFHNQCKLAHLEAGLRSFNKHHPYPEESYRSMISKLTDIHFCPSEGSAQHLQNEKVCGKIWNVGNTIIDMMIETLQKNAIQTTPSIDSNQILITLHRRENWLGMADTFSQIELLAKAHSELQFLFLKHPNPELHALVETQMPSVHCLPPQTHLECLKLLAKCRFVITDSGGIQEEASALGKKLIVLRETTERDELLGDYVTLCNDKLSETFTVVNSNPVVSPSVVYGDGNTAKKILDILRNDSIEYTDTNDQL